MTDFSAAQITDDFLIRMLKGCVQLQSRPDISNTINQVPVDHVARVIAASTFNPPVEPLGVAQVTSHPRLTTNEFLGALENHGYNVSKVDYESWRDHVDQYVADSSKEEFAL